VRVKQPLEKGARNEFIGIPSCMQSRICIVTLILCNTTRAGILVDLALPEETNEETYSWVNGTITNLGEIAICNVAFASRDTDLTTDALDVVPINLPTTSLSETLFDSVDLAPGESIEFAYFLPFNAARNAPAFVGLSKSLHACSEAKEKFVPELPEFDEVETIAGAADQLVDAANVAVDATQKTTGEMLDTTQQFAQGLIDGSQDKLDATIDSLQAVSKQPELTDITTTIPTTTEDKSVAEALAEAKAAGADALEVEGAAKASDVDSSVAEIPTKEAQKEAETTSPASTRSASGSVILLGTIAALSVLAFFA
jgi:hypothetical protein